MKTSTRLSLMVGLFFVNQLAMAQMPKTSTSSSTDFSGYYFPSNNKSVVPGIEIEWIEIQEADSTKYAGSTSQFNSYKKLVLKNSTSLFKRTLGEQQPQSRAADT